MLNKHNIYQDYLAFSCVEEKVEELSQAKYELARACFYAMMAEGLSWEEIFFPILANVAPNSEVEQVLELLLETMKEEGMPDLKSQFES